MYNFDTFLTIDVLKEILNEYEWPLEYKLEEYSDEIIIEFPKCTLIIREGFDSEMNAYFLNEQTGRGNIQNSLELFHALQVLRPPNSQDDEELELRGLVKNLEVEASLEKVKQGVRNICILLQAYLLPCIKGDFSWVEEFNKMYPGA